MICFSISVAKIDEMSEFRWVFKCFLCETIKRKWMHWTKPLLKIYRDIDTNLNDVDIHTVISGIMFEFHAISNQQPAELK